MYSSSLTSTDRSGAVAASIAIQAALLLAFLNMSGKIDLNDTQPRLRLVDILPPSPPQPVLEQRVTHPRDRAGAAASKNIKSEATPVAAPKPVIELPRVSPIVATPTPRQAVDPTQGASPVRGPGTGAGGVGNGTGSGGAGDGWGDGGGVAEPPHLATPVLRGYDFPREMLDEWPPAATVFLRLKVDSRGYVSECLVDRGTNVPQIDADMCNRAHERLRFRPALNRSGQAVAGWFGYAQPAPR
jgi:periplasmic protein TonB